MTAKRDPPPAEADEIATERQRLNDNGIIMVDSFMPFVADDTQFDHSSSEHFGARMGIQYSIALVAAHAAFDSTTPQVMESFTGLVETYIESIIEETKRLAIASRREHPIPSDFEAMLRRFNLPISSLSPHLMTPLQKQHLPIIAPQADIGQSADFQPLPLLGLELSGQEDKDAKSYIPNTFPDFPSKHTYKFTPQDDERIRDSQKIREEAALGAQQGEDALRRLVHASKVRKQKEAKTLVERDSHGRERFRLWESTMKRFMNGTSIDSTIEQVEIADHSMIVNGDAAFSRKDVSRGGKRPTVTPGRRP